MEKKAKKNIIGNIGCLAIIIYMSVITWRGCQETDYVKKHGVWTILTITKMEGAPRGFLFSYKFQYNYRTYNYTIVSSNRLCCNG